MKLSIRARLILFFTAALMVFALVSGLMFSRLFTRAVIDAKRDELMQKAARLSGALSDALGTVPKGGRMQGQGGQMMNYTAFVRALSLAEPNLWVLDEQLNFLSSGHMMGRKLEYSALPKDAGALVEGVFQGRSAMSEGFSELTGEPTFTVGAPIYQEDRVVGALLLNDAVAGTDAAAAQGKRILLWSAGLALLVSILLAVWLSHSFTRPISRMQETALRLSQGDYGARTGIKGQDEIAQLAHSIDTLSQRLKEAKDESERQEQARRDFLASVSHELRTPVTVLKASLEAMRDGLVSDPEKREEYVSQMLSETQGLHVLVNDLLELARLENPGFPIEREPLILQDVLKDAIRAAERLAAPKNIAIDAKIHPDPLPFEGDYARLRQMLLVVLDNAVKFSPEESRIDVQLSDHEIAVTDQGPGIPDEDLPHLFQRFHREGKARADQGSGLGLAIAREIAQRHHMSIDVSTTIHEGSTFSFRWDVHAQQAAANKQNDPMMTKS